MPEFTTTPGSIRAQGPTKAWGQLQKLTRVQPREEDRGRGQRARQRGVTGFGLNGLDFEKEFSSTQRTFAEFGGFDSSASEGLKQKLSSSDNDPFAQSADQKERGERGCSGNFVSDCYESLLDTRIDDLQREMRRLETEYWGNKL